MTTLARQKAENLKHKRNALIPNQSSKYFIQQIVFKKQCAPGCLHLYKSLGTRLGTHLYNLLCNCITVAITHVMETVLI